MISNIYNEGDVYSWETWGGKKYSGIIKEIEGDCIHVLCDDNIMRVVNIIGGGS
jgi:hypothetical protein